MEVGEKARRGSDYKTVKIFCSLEAIHALERGVSNGGQYQKDGSEMRHCKGMLAQMHKNNGQGLLKADI